MINSEDLNSLPQLLLTRERTNMLLVLHGRLKSQIAGYVWAIKGIHPIVLLLISFVISQCLNELIIYEIFEAYGSRSVVRTVAEIVLPLTLWFFVDSIIHLLLIVLGLGQRIIVQTTDGTLHVFHRKLFSPKCDKFDLKFQGSLGLTSESMGYVIDRLNTSNGRYYIWSRWRDVRLVLLKATPLSTIENSNPQYSDNSSQASHLDSNFACTQFEKNDHHVTVQL